MAAYNGDITLPDSVATLLTTSDVSAVRVQNTGEGDIRLKATVGAVVPTSWVGALTLRPGEAFDAGITLANLFPGVSGANRVYALTSRGYGKASVSHA